MSDTDTDNNFSEEYTRHQEVREREIETNADMDYELKGIWERMNGPEAKEKEFLKDPPMPPTPAGLSEHDVGKAIYDWNKTPIEDRQSIAKVHRGLSDMKQAADSLGLPIKTAADLKAAREFLNGETGINGKPAPIDRETQASLDTFRAVVPNAKDHHEAAAHLGKWVEAIKADPITGWRALLQAQGVKISDLLQPEERNAMDGADAALVNTWLEDRGLSQDDGRAMAEIIKSENWKHIPEENTLRTLERARKEWVRSNSRQTAHKAAGDSLDVTLRAMARKAYGE
jgi:hypothetical protein